MALIPHLIVAVKKKQRVVLFEVSMLFVFVLSSRRIDLFSDLQMNTAVRDYV
jgi:hypothetical protein